MNPLFHTEFSISDSLKNVRKSILIYETIIVRQTFENLYKKFDMERRAKLSPYANELDEDKAEECRKR